MNLFQSMAVYTLLLLMGGGYALGQLDKKTNSRGLDKDIVHTVNRNGSQVEIGRTGTLFDDFQSIGTVGSIANEQRQIVDGDFPNTTDLHYWRFSGDTNDDGPNTAINLTQFGSPRFDGKGFFGNSASVIAEEDVITFNGQDQYLEENNAFFNLNGSDATLMVWAYMDNWADSKGRALFEIHDDTGGSLTSDTSIDLTKTSQNTLEVTISNGATANQFTIPVKPELFKGWMHFAITHDTSAGDTILYVNGQVANQNLGGVTFAAGRQILIVGGRLQVVQDHFLGKMRDLVIHKGTILTQGQINAIYSRRYTNNPQLAGGHTLSSASFPFSSDTGNAYFWNMESANDSSSNGLNFTTVGSPSFDGPSMFGVANKARVTPGNYFKVTNSVFNSKTFSMGGCFKPIDGSLSTEVLMAIGDDGSSANRRARLWTSTDTILSDGGSGSQYTVVDIKEMDHRWLCLAHTYDGFRSRLYVNGKLEAVGTDVVPVQSGTPTLHIGRRGDTAEEASVFIDNVWFVSRALTADEVKKLVSSKVDHNKSLSDMVGWELQELDEDGKSNSIVFPGVVESSANSLYGLWSDLDAGSVINLKMK